MNEQATLIESRVIEFEVLGVAAPKGSKRHVGRGIMVESSKRERPWRDSVSSAAALYMRGAPLLRDVPLALTVTFYFQRPRSHYGKHGLNAKGRSTPRPITKPDVSKLVRSLEDALIGIVFDDDSRIVTEHIEKWYVVNGEYARAVVRVESE